MPVAGFISAIFISSFFKLDFSFSFCLIFIAIILFIFQKFFVTEDGEKKKVFLISIFLFCFAAGALRYEAAEINPDPVLEQAVGTKVILKAVVSVEPAEKQSGAALTVDVKDLITEGSITPVSGRVLVNTSLYPQFHYGDMVSILGVLAKPENFPAAPSLAKDFDYTSYLAKDSITYVMDFAQVSLIASGRGNPLETFLLKIKDAFTGTISRVIPEPEASLLSGIELGAKSSMDKETANNFRVTGLSQIVVLSGYNVTVVAQAIASLLSFLPRMVGLSGGIIGIILFVIMSGSSSTAIRAGIMGLIAIIAVMTKRDYRAGRALVVATMLLIIINPKILVFDISFQLSFLATVAIIYLAPVLKSRFLWITERYGMRDIITSTIAAQILVLPLIVCDMGQLSLYALPANILVLPFVPMVMFFGFATGMLGFLWTPVSLPFSWITFAILFYMIRIAKLFAGLPFSTSFISWFSPVLMFVTYILIGLWIVHERKNKNI